MEKLPCRVMEWPRWGKIPALVMIFASLGLLSAVAEDWTVGANTYHNVTVTKVDADKVHITYDEGIGSINLADLPPDLQKRFGYSPDNGDAPASPTSPGETSDTSGIGNPSEVAAELTSYKAKVSHAVSARWNAKVSTLIDIIPAGTVKIQYTVNSDGTVEIKPLEKTEANQLLLSISTKAIEESAPFSPFSDKLLKQMGDSYTDIFIFSISDTKQASVK